jgi:hypothetical protein
MGRQTVLAIPAGRVLNEEKQTEERDPQSEFIIALLCSCSARLSLPSPWRKRKLDAFCGKPVIGRSNSKRFPDRTLNCVPQLSDFSGHGVLEGANASRCPCFTTRSTKCFVRSGMSSWSLRRSANQRAPRKKALRDKHPKKVPLIAINVKRS